MGKHRMTTKTSRAAVAVRLGLILAISASACRNQQNVQCAQDIHCNLNGGGICFVAPTGNRWCAYPDSSCESGYKYSDDDVGDGVSGICTPSSDSTPDAGIIPAPPDAAPDATIIPVPPIVVNHQPAELVLGQPDFTADTPNNGGPSAKSLQAPSRRYR